MTDERRKLQIVWNFYRPGDDHPEWTFSRQDDDTVKVEYNAIDPALSGELVISAADWNRLVGAMAQ